MRRLLTAAISLSLLATLFVAAPASAHHVKALDCEYDPIPTLKAERFGPKADPWFRYKVTVTGYRKASLTCKGTLTIPDASWSRRLKPVVVAKHDKELVLARPLAGDTIKMAPGSYVVIWGNGRTTEFRIQAHMVPVGDTTFRLGYIGKNGKRLIRVDIPSIPGCAWRSGWHYSKPFTKQWVQRNQPFQQRIKTWDSGRGGNFGAITFRPARGVTCPDRVFTIA